jgi:NDP-sugar pyrophosphorylase family protein
VGTVTDGDVRRGILRGVALEDPVKLVMNSNPATASEDSSRAKILEQMHKRGLRHMPIVSWRGLLVGLEIDSGLVTPARDNWVVLMAGGLGTRLRPFTSVFPKPLLPVGEKPLMETTLEALIAHGFHKFFISVNYKAKLIEEYFGDGKKWGVKIKYVHESKRMGTAGSLTLLPGKPTQPVLVINGDVLTKINYQQLLDFHLEQRARATMCVREYDFQVPYGVVETEKHKIVRISEKPTERLFVNAGIYVLDPAAVAMIPKRTRFDMTALFERLIRKKQDTAAFPVREYWMDIGRVVDFERASADYEEEFE